MRYLILQDIQRTYIFDFMPRQFMAEITLYVVVARLKDYADDDYLFHYQEETYCSVFCIQLKVYSQFNDYYQRVKEKCW